MVRLLDHLNIGRAHIIGHSMGAGITAQLLTTHPDRFLTATLSGSAGRHRWTPEDAAAAEAEAVEFEHGVPFRSVILDQRAHLNKKVRFRVCVAPLTSFLINQYLRQLRKAEGGLRSMNTAQTGDPVENLGQ